MNPVDTAARRLELAKRTEAMASAARVEAEKELIALLPVKDEGSVTMKGAQYKVSVTYGFNRTVDAQALEAIKREVPSELFEQAIDYKPSLVLAGLRYLQSNEPDTYAMLAQAITSKPSKPSVKIEALAEELREAA
ncbi:DUF7173 family protein [Luteibacter sp. E-22]|uniref:DUF7173 family protein n=1 Tax=Luteibacter sp. E-22 TaxID=3404050 RepID=UPI003CEDA21C